jgi:type I restriction enzyme R subunit
MSNVGERERQTQWDVLTFLDKHLGYRYLGDWKDRNGNRNIEEDPLRDWLARQGHKERVINHALRELDQAAAGDDSIAIEAERAE